MSAKLEFHIAGSPNDAFFSQVALFALGLRALGGAYADARIVFSTGHDAPWELPDRWRRPLADVEIRRVPMDAFAAQSYFAQLEARFGHIGADAGIVVFCDADVFPLRPFDPLVADLLARPGVGGVIAHHTIPHRRGWPAPDVWAELAGHCGVKTPELRHKSTLAPAGSPPADAACPFYINFGFVIADRSTFAAIGPRCIDFRRRLAGVLEHPYFAGQAAFALAVADAGVRTRSLPMRYNFPNDPVAERRWPVEMANACLLHYLRTDQFDRAVFMTAREHFERFLALPLCASSELLRARLAGLTGGDYPFS